MTKDKTPVDKEKEIVKEKKPPAKKEKYEGHRWSSLILFFLTILAGAFFYLTGEH